MEMSLSPRKSLDRASEKSQAVSFSPNRSFSRTSIRISMLTNKLLFDSPIKKAEVAEKNVLKPGLALMSEIDKIISMDSAKEFKHSLTKILNSSSDQRKVMMNY